MLSYDHPALPLCQVSGRAPALLAAITAIQGGNRCSGLPPAPLTSRRQWATRLVCVDPVSAQPGLPGLAGLGGGH